MDSSAKGGGFGLDSRGQSAVSSQLKDLWDGVAKEIRFYYVLEGSTNASSARKLSSRSAFCSS